MNWPEAIAIVGITWGIASIFVALFLWLARDTRGVLHVPNTKCAQKWKTNFGIYQLNHKSNELITEALSFAIARWDDFADAHLVLHVLGENPEEKLDSKEHAEALVEMLLLSETHE